MTFALRVAVGFGALLVSNAGPARAEPPPSGAMPTPIDGLGEDLADAFTGTNLLWYGGAVVGSTVMAFSGADHSIRVAVQRGISAPAYADASYYAGYLAPVIVAPLIYVSGLLGRDPKTAGAGSAAVQALAVTFVTTSFLKLAIGRVYPLDGGDPNAPDRLDHPENAHTFRPFQPSDASIAAWPSGHTSTTISIAAALAAYYPDEIWIPFVGYPLALAIGFGMMVRDSHWASDVVGGAIIGHTIGYSIGKAYRRRVRNSEGEDGPTGLRLVPVVGLGYGGFGVGASW